MNSFRIFLLLGLVIALLLQTACSSDEEQAKSKLSKLKEFAAESQNSTPTEQPDESPSKVADLVNRESLIRQTHRSIRRLSRAVKQLTISSVQIPGVFRGHFKVKDIASVTEDAANDATQHVKFETRNNYAGSIWSPLFDKVEFFEKAKFYNIRVTSVEDRSHVVETGFAGLARSKSGKWWSVKAHGEITWTKSGSEDWQIAYWDFGDIKILESDAKKFKKVTSSIFSQREFATVASSPQRALFLNVLRKGAAAFSSDKLRDHFRHIPVGQHAAVSIVDINGDGLDDFYLSEQYRNNRLYLNSGNGTFQEAAARFGLDIPQSSTSSIFADFDNDGDLDLFVGNSLDPCQYFENIEGKFEDRTSKRVSFELPSLVSSLSAADFNNDGLLDLYISTYGFPSARGASKNWMDVFLSPKEASIVRNLIASPSHNRYLDATGPSNYLLENKGDHFEVSEHNSTLAVYKNTLQSTWSDFDNDGDADLFVSNDFAPDFLFRNDGERGFVDATLSSGDDTMLGFGMGAAWGDINHDGQRDLYVSNMYSKAGRRIVNHFADLDKRYLMSAEGNRLYVNTEGRLRNNADAASMAESVKNAGWSWGGQLVDFDNDGFLDIYVASGYFTAPKILSSDKDL